jgi:ATP-dependent exoDNAse (exonuclease V) alpha subunit
MVTQNLWTEQGIVNGASGRVIDFIKDGDECVAIVVDVPKYRGPPLCGEAVERRTWIPIQRQEATWCTGRNAHTCKREQFPLTLSYAVTIHKSQGSSFDVPVVVDIGKADQTCGSTYVAMSRCTASDRIFHSGYARERITKNFASPAFICRMKEEKRLLRLHSLRIHVPENQ